VAEWLSAFVSILLINLSDLPLFVLNPNHNLSLFPLFVVGLPTGQGQNLRLAKVNTDMVFTAPCETSILYPAAGGNMHCFTAKTSCAVLDVLGPPYDDSAKRHCTYYNAFPCASTSGMFSKSFR